MTQKLLTVDEVAERLRRTPAAIRAMRYEGKGPKSAKVAGRVMWREEDVDAYIEGQFTETSA
ncbi:putative DNA-binding transcriptional regulator AlpA [Frigoribacterium sp. PvP120]|uniref:helix-turn-helix transcriptional regulator n=1 Tax=unclassified Frigoribacterium TaxID=2627005 RepID=UPI001AE4CF43|nr:helix-turn-helix domain-containing protein [Frigoribacterium sp. PvP121]MBP1241720.1 putative DNA-binding transcriptional regulator AlpA [Frigoribacterium sp. PvP121]